MIEGLGEAVRVVPAYADDLATIGFNGSHAGLQGLRYNQVKWGAYCVCPRRPYLSRCYPSREAVSRLLTSAIHG